MSGGGRCRLGESALDRARVVRDRDTDWEITHLRVGVVWGKTPTGRERTLEWKGMSGGGRHRLEESVLESG